MEQHNSTSGVSTLASSLLIASLLVIASGWASAQAASCTKSPPEGVLWQKAENPEALSKATFYTGYGEPKSLQDYKGLGLVINFWATWCAPCVREMPALNTLQKEQGDAMTMAVLPISLDRGGARATDPFYEMNNLDALPVLIDNKRKMAQAIGVSNLPTTLIIDRSGREVGRFLGEAHWDGPDMVAFLESCFGKAK